MKMFFLLRIVLELSVSFRIDGVVQNPSLVQDKSEDYDHHRLCNIGIVDDK